MRAGIPAEKAVIYASFARGEQGAELKIVAQFPEGTVLINQFDDVRRAAGGSPAVVAEERAEYGNEGEEK